MSDQISITGIHAFGFHGVYDHERENGQDFFVDVKLELSLAKASKSDALSDTVHKPAAPVDAQVLDIAVTVERSR